MSFGFYYQSDWDCIVYWPLCYHRQKDHFSQRDVASMCGETGDVAGITARKSPLQAHMYLVTD